MQYDSKFFRSSLVTAGTIICVMLAVSGCGMSSLTSGLGSGLFGKQSTTKVENVTEEQLLSAAKSHNGPASQSIAAINVAHGCPRFEVWVRDNAITKYADGQVGDGLAIMHRGEITRTARECRIEPGRVTVKYGFSGRILLGPKGQSGRVALPATVFVTDAKRERIAQEKLTIAAEVSLDKPISYFSQVKTVTFNIPPGSRPGEFEVFVGFDTQELVPGL